MPRATGNEPVGKAAPHIGKDNALSERKLLDHQNLTRAKGSTGMLAETQAALNTICRLEGEWPSRDDLLHNRNGLPVAVSTSTPIDVLPFGLERIYSENEIKTRDDATRVLASLCVLWGNLLNEPVPNSVDYIGATVWLSKHNALAHQRLSKSMYRESCRVLCRLAKDVEQQCAYGAEYARYGCPGCEGGRLFRPYTAAGLLDSYVCDGCGESWTVSQMRAYVSAASKVCGLTPHVEMRIVDAAKVLDESKETIANRIRRRRVEPAVVKGKTKLFWLDDLV